ncbi:hypothetical protein KFU94_17030 [Chloroflexi bacterium TSY]|nr:hypothetical protein [Chloroflexi bacterium TSY]
MVILPQNTILGHLEIFEIYEFYNMPVLFACINQADHIYLAVWIAETEQENVWLYVALSPQRFAKVRSGQIDLHDAFALPEDDIVSKVIVTKDTNHKSDVKPLPIETVDETWPPLPGDYLDVPDSLPRVLWNGLDQRNPQINNRLKNVNPEAWYHQLGIQSLVNSRSPISV